MKHAGEAAPWFAWVVLWALTSTFGCRDEPPPCPRVAPHTTIRLTTEPAGPEFEFRKPVVARLSPDASTWLVAEQGGRVVAIDANGRNRRVALELEDQVASPSENWEWGLLGLAIHPEFPAEPSVYLYYTTPAPDAPAGIATVLSTFPVDPETYAFEAEQETELLRLEQPGSFHQGGTIGFGPEGLLWVAVGDGGGDAAARAQDPSNLFGTLLRLDVAQVGEASRPYGIPDGQPIRDGAAPEVYAFGLRNPWQWSFDMETGALWAGDVGGNSREEINRIQLGANYGWPVMEGRTINEPQSRDSSVDFETPVTEYCHTDGRAVTGGFVYRGEEMPALQGTYIFADFISGKLMGIAADADGFTQPTQLGEVPYSISSFARDDNGELYVLDRTGGGMHKIVRAARADDPPTQLSETGYVNPDSPQEPPSDALRYNVRVPFFSDDAGKSRWMFLPEGQQASLDARGQVQLPVGTVLVKHFRRGERPVETRLLIHRSQDVWKGYSYAWNETQTDARLLQTDRRAQIGGAPWLYPSRADCSRCHVKAAGFALGFEAQQLGPQLEEWSEQGLLAASELTQVQDDNPVLVELDDTSISVSARARAYLHVNCSFCHRPRGPGGGTMDLRYRTALEQMGVCDVPPSVDDMRLADARLVAPGRPDSSVLLARMQTTGHRKMNPFRQTVDTQGVDLVRRWIEELQGCP